MWTVSGRTLVIPRYRRNGGLAEASNLSGMNILAYLSLFPNWILEQCSSFIRPT